MALNNKLLTEITNINLRSGDGSPLSFVCNFHKWNKSGRIQRYGLWNRLGIGTLCIDIEFACKRVEKISRKQSQNELKNFHRRIQL